MAAISRADASGDASGDAACGCASATLSPLRDGTEVVLRDARREDASELRRMFFALGDTTRYFYFFTGAPSDESWAKRVVALGVADGRTSYALVAEVEGMVVGVARFVRNADARSAEVGVLIEDAWQARGLGTSMMARLSEEARRRVVVVFTGQILGENRRAIRLVRRAFPGARIALSGGVYDVLAQLDDPVPAGELSEKAK